MRLIHALPVALIAVLIASSARADELPLLHPLFSDHAVLQRGRAVPLWGWTKAGATIRIRFADQERKVNAAADGRWACQLDPLEASAIGRSLTVEVEGTEQRMEVKDLLVGDVWLCSGQSNMEMNLSRCREEQEIASAHDNGIRLLTIPKRRAYLPQQIFTGAWKVCSPDALREDGGFSAAAYFFGKKLREELGVPVGLIHASLGGTVAEAWTGAAALGAFPEFAPKLQELQTVAQSKAVDPEAEYLDAWFCKHDPGTAKGWQRADADTTGWREVRMPGNWGDCGIKGFEGVVWLQRQLDLPEAWVGKRLVVKLGAIADNDTAWLNGREIGRTNGFDLARCYEVAAGVAKAGGNVMSLRVTNFGGGGLMGKSEELRIHPVGEEAAAISLAGAWRLQETAKRDDTGQPLVGDSNVPSVLFNGMIAPLQPAAMTGVIWYQGEANVPRARQYRRLLPALIGDWRRGFQQEDLGFHIVSLANYQDVGEQPRDHAWAELREAQALTAKSVPRCGLALAIDIGNPADIHPHNKREVGRRLALNALASIYQKPVAGSGPWFRSLEPQGAALRLRFDHADGGLVFKGNAARSFAVAGEDRKFVWADALIDGETILVSSPAVLRPVAVRYAWDANPAACLYNGAGLPAVPFRSDEWPGITSER